MQRTADDKQQENRLHLDLRTADLGRQVRRTLGPARPPLTDHPVTERHILAIARQRICVLQPPGDELIPRPNCRSAPSTTRQKRAVYELRKAVNSARNAPGLVA